MSLQPSLHLPEPTRHERIRRSVTHRLKMVLRVAARMRGGTRRRRRASCDATCVAVLPGKPGRRHRISLARSRPVTSKPSRCCRLFTNHRCVPFLKRSASLRLRGGDVVAHHVRAGRPKVHPSCCAIRDHLAHAGGDVGVEPCSPPGCPDEVVRVGSSRPQPSFHAPPLNTSVAVCFPSVRSQHGRLARNRQRPQLGLQAQGTPMM